MLGRRITVGSAAVAIVLASSAMTVQANAAGSVGEQSYIAGSLPGVPPGTPSELDRELVVPQQAGAAMSASSDECQMPTDEGQVTACVKRVPPTAEARADLERMMSREGDFSAQAIQPLPQWCVDNAFTGIWFTRTQICEIFGVEYTLYQMSNGVRTITGVMNANVYSYEYMSASLGSFAHQFQHSAYRITGHAAYYGYQ